MRLYEGQKANFLDLRHRHADNLDSPRGGEKVMMILDLLDDPDEMWKRFDAKLRNQVRKASKSGLTAGWSSKEGLSDFYKIFAANMRDLGSPVHSHDFFGAILDEFSDSAKIMLVRKDEDSSSAAAVCIFFKGSMIVPWASSLREYFSLCPNNLLYWEMVRWGCENGYRRFDFGRSSPDSGTYRFKKQWGAKEEPLHWQCVSRKIGRAAMPHADDARVPVDHKTLEPSAAFDSLNSLVLSLRGQVSS